MVRQVAVIAFLIAIVVDIQAVSDPQWPAAASSSSCALWNTGRQQGQPDRRHSKYNRQINAKTQRDLFWQFDVNNEDSHRVSSYLGSMDAARVLNLRYLRSMDQNRLAPATASEVQQWIHSRRLPVVDLNQSEQLDLSAESHKLPRIKCMRPVLRNAFSLPPNRQAPPRPQLDRSYSEHTDAPRDWQLAAKRFNWTPAPSTSSSGISLVTTQIPAVSSQASLVSSKDSAASVPSAAVPQIDTSEVTSSLSKLSLLPPLDELAAAPSELSPTNKDHGSFVSTPANVFLSSEDIGPALEAKPPQIEQQYKAGHGLRERTRFKNKSVKTQAQFRDESRNRHGQSRTKPQYGQNPFGDESIRNQAQFRDRSVIDQTQQQSRTSDTAFRGRKSDSRPCQDTSTAIPRSSFSRNPVPLALQGRTHKYSGVFRSRVSSR